MTQIVISSNDKNIITDAETLKVKAEFAKKGFRQFPHDLMKEHCPYKHKSKVREWLIRARTIWQLRGRDKDILSIFNKAYNQLEA